MKKALIALLILSALGPVVYAQGTAPAAPQQTYQEQYLELLRSDLRTEKVAVITEGMQMTDAESAIFWPLYRKYDGELNTLNDERIAVIKDFAQNFDMMTAAKAEELTNRTFAYFENRIKLQKKYFKEIAKALNPIFAAKFMQIERTINTLVDLQIQSQIPIAK